MVIPAVRTTSNQLGLLRICNDVFKFQPTIPSEMQTTLTVPCSRRPLAKKPKNHRSKETEPVPNSHDNPICSARLSRTERRTSKASKPKPAANNVPKAPKRPSAFILFPPLRLFPAPSRTLCRLATKQGG